MADIAQALRNEIFRLKSRTTKLEQALAAVESADRVPRRKKRTMSPQAIEKIRKAKLKWWKARKSGKKTSAA